MISRGIEVNQFAKIHLTLESTFRKDPLNMQHVNPVVWRGISSQFSYLRIIYINFVNNGNRKGLM